MTIASSVECAGARERIKFKKELFDTNDVFNLEESVFVAPVSGLYHFEVLTVNFADGGEMWCGVAELINNGADIRVKVEAGIKGYTGGFGISLPVGTNLLLPKGSKIVAFYKQGIDTALDIGTQDPERLRTTQFSGFLVAPYEEGLSE